MSDHCAVKLFYSYSHKDEELRNKLNIHLKSLQRRSIIDAWCDRDIDAGSEWQLKIDENLDNADIILFLVSADFIASDYCSSIEVKRAMEKHDNQSAVVIPVSLRPASLIMKSL